MRLPSAMRRYSLQTTLIVVMLAAVLLGYFRDPLIQFVRFKFDREPLELISSDAQLEVALAKEHAVIFINADWSVHSAMNRTKMESFARNWRWQRCYPKIDFYMVDITDRNPKLDVVLFSKLDPRLAHLQGGSGEVIWLKAGKVRERTSRMLADHDLTVMTDESFNR